MIATLSQLSVGILHNGVKRKKEIIRIGHMIGDKVLSYSNVLTDTTNNALS